MVGENEVLSSLSPMATGALNTGVIFMVVITSLVFAGLMIWGIMSQRKWNQFKVVIWSKDAYGQVIESYDKGGIFVDKKINARRFFLKKNKSNLPPDDMPVIHVNNKRIVYLKQTGLKNFEYVKPQEIMENKYNLITEQDVNWAILEYEKQKALYANDNWSKYLPYIALAVVALVIMIIFIYFFKKLDVLKEFGQQLVEAAKLLNPQVIQ